MRNRVNILIHIILWCGVSACTPNQSIYKQCKKQVAEINEMTLRVAYLAPVDSLDRYVNEEVVLPNMYERCELIPNYNPDQVHLLGALYFDSEGRLRKAVQHWADGGDLNNVLYYDEQGTVIYAVYACGQRDYGRIYARDSKLYLEHSFSDLTAGHYGGLEIKSDDWVHNYKVDLQVPDSCRSVRFLPIQKGDAAFLCAHALYDSPNGAIVREVDEETSEAWFGRLVYVDSVDNGWCRLKAPSFDQPLGYVSMDSIELAYIRIKERKNE